MAINRYPITIIGCGPGSADYVTPIARSCAADAEVLVGAQRLLDLFPESGKDHIPVKSHIAGVLDEIEELAKTKRIAILVTGDPGLMSLAKSVVARFGRSQCRTMAGISSFQAAFAALNLDWLNARIIDSHEGPPDIDIDTIAATGKIAVLAGNEKSFPWIADLGERLGDSWHAFLCTNLTLPEEKVVEVNTAELATGSHPSLSIVIFVKKEQLL